MGGGERAPEKSEGSAVKGEKTICSGDGRPGAAPPPPPRGAWKGERGPLHEEELPSETVDSSETVGVWPRPMAGAAPPPVGPPPPPAAHVSCSEATSQLA